MNWWQYLLLANVYLALFYGFYVILLRRETFFQLNRVYLISSALLSFLIPLIQAEWARNLFITQRINQTIYGLDTVNVINVQIPVQQNQGFTFGEGLVVIYLGGIVFLLGKFLMQLYLLRNALNNPAAHGAYSFFSKIILDGNLVDRKTIMAHEQVHARQLHSADVLFVETIMIINWFNPVVYLYRKAIKHIHEFIADRHALNAGASRQEYALLLLSETFKAPINQLVNPFFNHTLLKQRIMMLQKDRSQRIALVKYGLSAPLFALMIIFSSATVKTNNVITRINIKANELMLLQTRPVVTDIAITPKTIKAAVKNSPVQKTKLSFYTSPQQSAEFPGGVGAFGAFLGKTIKMTPEIKATLPQKAVIVQFIVEKNGLLTNMKVLRGTGPSAAEAVRALSLSPRWKPGKQNGVVVRQQYTVPVKFSMMDEQNLGKAGYGNDSKAIFTVVDQSAEFPGGINAFSTFLGKNIKITPEIRAMMPFPKVICEFIVEQDGTLTNFRVLRGSGLREADNEAIRVLTTSPKWVPGTQNGNPVRQQYTIPIAFTAAAVQKVGVVKGKTASEILGKSPVIDTTRLHTYVLTTPRISPSAAYFINGKIADKAHFNAINPHDIASITVRKPSASDDSLGGHQTINIVTKKRTQ